MNKFQIYIFAILSLIFQNSKGSPIYPKTLRQQSEDGFEKCLYKDALGLDAQILERIRKSIGDFKIPEDEPEKFALDIDMKINALPSNDMLTDIKNAQEEGNKKMVIKQGVVLQGQQYLKWQWNEVKEFQKCGLNGKRPGESVFNSGLAVELEDTEFWQPIMENNNFQYYAEEHAFIHKGLDQSLMPKIFQAQVDISNESQNHISLNYQKIDGKLKRSEIDSMLYRLDDDSLNRIGDTSIYGYGVAFDRQEILGFNNVQIIDDINQDVLNKGMDAIWWDINPPMEAPYYMWGEKYLSTRSHKGPTHCYLFHAWCRKGNICDNHATLVQEDYSRSLDKGYRDSRHGGKSYGFYDQTDFWEKYHTWMIPYFYNGWFKKNCQKAYDKAWEDGKVGGTIYTYECGWGDVNRGSFKFNFCNDPGVLQTFSNSYDLGAHSSVEYEIKVFFEGNIPTKQLGLNEYIKVFIDDQEVDKTEFDQANKFHVFKRRIPHSNNKLKLKIECKIESDYFDFDHSRACGLNSSKLKIFRCQNGCSSCTDENRFKCTGCSDSDNRLALDNQQCFCKPGFIDQGHQQCLSKRSCTLMFNGPYYNFQIPANNQTNIEKFDNFKEAAERCDEVFECEGIVYSQKWDSKYTYQLRNSLLIQGMYNWDQYNEFENGQSITWVKNYDTQCCYPSCNMCFKYQDFSGCIDCKEGFFMQGTACVKFCDTGYYKDIDSQSCKKCNWQCSRCDGGGEDQCTKCSNNLKKESDFRTPSRCLEECPEGKGYNSRKRYCETCHENCASCNDLTNLNCPVCKPNIYHYDNKECLDSCPIGFGADDENWRCFQCHYSCLVCDGPEQNQCLECEGGKLLDFEDRTCNDSCKEGKFNILGKVCALQCPRNLNYDRVGMECVEQCPEGYHQKENSQECVKCLEQGEGWKIQDLLCVENCHTGYYMENEQLCSPCHNTCRSCTGPSANHCTGCSPPLELRSGRCIQVCVDQQYYNTQLRKCDTCFASCEVCTDFTHKCKKCNQKFPYYIPLESDDRECYSECPPGYKKQIYQDSWVFNEIECVQCNPENDQDCIKFAENSACIEGFSSNSSGDCQQCKVQYCLRCSSDDSKKCEECTQNFYLDSSSELCAPCHKSCLTCSGPLKNDCLTCKNHKNEGECQENSDNNTLYSINLENPFKYSDDNNLQMSLSLKQDTHRSIVLDTGSPNQKKLAQSQVDCEFFGSSTLENNKENLQDLFLFANILGQKGVKSTKSHIDFSDLSTTEEKKEKINSESGFITPKDLNSDITHGQIIADKQIVTNLLELNSCNQFLSSYKLKDSLKVYQNTPENLFEVSITKESQSFHFSDQEGHILSDKKIKQGHVEVQENDLEIAKNLIKSLSLEEFSIVTIKGKLRESNKISEVQALLTEDDGAGVYTVYSPLLGQSFSIHLQGQNADENHPIFLYYNVRRLQKVNVEQKDLLSDKYKFGIRVQKAQNDENLFKCLNGYKSDNFDTLVLDINNIDGQRDIDAGSIQGMIDLAKSNGFKVSLVYNPCHDKIAEEVLIKLKEAGLDQDEVKGKYEHLWVDMNGVNEFSDLYDTVVKKCEFDRVNSAKNIEIMKDLVGQIKQAGIPLGVYSNESVWKNRLKNTDFVTREFGNEVKLWERSTKDDNYEIKIDYAVGGWEEASVKTFKNKHFICGLETELFSFKTE